MLIPKGLLVNERAIAICSRKKAASAFIAAIKPRPPPLDTAAASFPSAIQAIPP